jgi:hypothetical protein
LDNGLIRECYIKMISLIVLAFGTAMCLFIKYSKILA